MLVYEMPAWPHKDFTLSVRVLLNDPQQDNPGQIFNAWAEEMDDPLRMIVAGGQVYARTGSGGASFSTPGVAIVSGRWYHVAAFQRDIPD